jgi:hypothetical protein
MDSMLMHGTPLILFSGGVASIHGTPWIEVRQHKSRQLDDPHHGTHPVLTSTLPLISGQRGLIQ